MWPVIDVQCIVPFVVLLNSLYHQVLSVVQCNEDIPGNSTYNSEGLIFSPLYPLLYNSFYMCVFKFQPLATGEYLELVFSDFVLESQETTRLCKAKNNMYSVKITQSSGVTEKHCERPKRQVFPLTEEAYVILQSESEHVLKVFRATYRFLERAEGERLSRQRSDEETAYNYDPRDNYQGSIDFVGSAEWVDVLQYIKAPTGYKIAIDATFMQDQRTSILEVHDGPTSESLELFRWQSSSKYSFASSQEWLYMRLYGDTSGGVTFDIDFTFFKELDSNGMCSSDYFQCSNYHCIPNVLVCNGIDNCYDGTDTNDEDSEGACRGSCAFECENGGRCSSNSCVCLEGFTGTYCEFSESDTVIGNCVQECLNGGSCNANNECQCAQGYFGPHCEYIDSGGGTDYTDLQHTSVMIGAFVGAVCLLSICWLIAMARKRQADLPQDGRLQRIISVHSPEESGLRRQSTIAASTNVDIPPNYSEAILFREGSFNNKPSQRGSLTNSQRVLANEPLSPPPDYDAVASENEDEGIVFRIPETVREDDDNENIESVVVLNERNALPDVVTSQENNPALIRHDTPV